MIEQVFSDFMDVSEYEAYVVSQIMDNRTSDEDDYGDYFSFEVEA